MAEPNAPLYVLLRRALDDDGPEGDNAWGMFAEKAKKQEGQIFFLTEDFANPLMFIVREQDARIEQLEAENAHLRKTIDAAGISPKKQKSASFPWDKYPELELRAFHMRFTEMRSPAEIGDYIASKAPEAEGNLTFINQRFVQNRPSPNFGIEVLHGTGPIDWKELWKIGTREHADGWVQRVMRYGKGWDKFHQEGHLPKNWIKLDPNKFISAKDRKALREMYHNNGFLSAGKELESLIEEAGPKGITRAALRKSGVSGRRFDIEKQSVIFLEGDHYVHYSFADQYPHNPAAQMAALKYQQLHGREVSAPVRAVA